ncbi:MAG: 50S ribosomal protein L21 [Candidatus Omnitrophica bacterium]|nr:50S ribosomal protein L21 [Candidatus Omnitrophota bacterium]
MYAVVEVGAKQYIVGKNDVLEVEKQKGAKGDELTLDKVLLVSKDRKIEVGRPYVKGASVQAQVLDDQAKAEKLVSFKYRRRKNSKWTKGHRQQLTRIRIKDICL